MMTATLPEKVSAAALAVDAPIYVYDVDGFIDRVRAVQASFPGYRYPVKANPDVALVQAAVGAGAGLDLCSEGDIAVAREVNVSPASLSYSATVVSDSSLRWLVESRAHFNADSLRQFERWSELTDRGCGLRVTAVDTTSSYGSKFGVPPHQVMAALGGVARERMIALHIHESHAGRGPLEISRRIVDALSRVGGDMLPRLEHINIGGGWVCDGDVAALAEFARELRAGLDDCLAATGFKGEVRCEPGESVAGPAGYLVARVSAVKTHPTEARKRIVILDVATPVPCRPSPHSFVVLEDSGVPRIPNDGDTRADVYGSANTGLDTLGLDVSIGACEEGDLVVSTHQGAYVRSLTGSFNERTLPPVVLV